ncbi:ATP-binding cassette domain-containing protein [Naasia lichenicola]|uniref:Sugar ABC transporter ATP-binding protein n=1 Tax=Naasia lichenicola TaxID=2565933 RepID=A0A4S4FGT6_9MICO|nr:ATP-binding cassette domain-containing protein [Naasia lichenicola]THG29331.1 sugar ABC transporter ATP-binding protein [Naasia lichenicola]
MPHGLDTTSAASPATANGYVLEAAGIRKAFGANVAISNASMNLREAEVMGLVGDNGAGKSTFLKILSGSQPADEGTITIEGKRVELRTPADALAAGIETVYQDLALVDTMDAAQNVFLGRERSAAGLAGLFGFVSDRKMRAEVGELVKDLGVNIPSLRATVRSMSGGQRQSLAIARAVLWGRRIVILDEPTAALGVRETAHVLDLIRRLRDRGISVIVVSHNMQQLREVADRVTVMRLGRTVTTRDIASTSVEDLIGLITGAVIPDETISTP